MKDKNIFVANITQWPIKDDLASMEHPIFSLSKNKDIKIREYTHPSTNKTVKIIPSVIGAATIFDKDLLLYAGSQVTEAIKEGIPVSRNIHINVYQFLLATERSTSNNAYKLFHNMLRRLKGTIIETDIISGGIKKTDGFGLIEDYKIIEQGKNIHSVSITLSEWLYNAFISHEILTLSKDYFHLKKPTERRLYELARKHCGNKAIWKCNIEIIKEKIGTSQDIRHFRSEIRSIIQRDVLPNYRIALDTSKKIHHIVFLTRNNQRLSAELLRSNLTGWYSTLEKTKF